MPIWLLGCLPLVIKTDFWCWFINHKPPLKFLLWIFLHNFRLNNIDKEPNFEIIKIFFGKGDCFTFAKEVEPLCNATFVKQDTPQSFCSIFVDGINQTIFLVKMIFSLTCLSLLNCLTISTFKKSVVFFVIFKVNCLFFWVFFPPVSSDYYLQCYFGIEPLILTTGAAWSAIIGRSK